MPPAGTDFWRATIRSGSAARATAGPSCSICCARPTASGLGAAARRSACRIFRASTAKRAHRGFARSAARVLRQRGVCWRPVIWLIALALVWLVATRFSRPDRESDRSAARVWPAGNFRIRVPNERTDEIGLATEAFNRTAAATRTEPRPPGLSDAARELAGAGAQDGA